MTALTRRLSVVVLTAVTGALPASAAHAYDVSYTDLPELQSATVVATTTAANASADTPAGTTIAFRFDEPVATSSPDPSMFAVYDDQGHRSTAAAVSVANATVTASFPAIDSEEKESALTLAVSEAGAVQDIEGDLSPIGSAGLTRWQSRTATGPQDCLRLGKVGPLRHVHGSTTVRVAFAPCSGGRSGFRAHGFRLQMVDGRSIRSIRVRAVHNYPLAAIVAFPGLHYRPRVARLTVASGAVNYMYYDAGETQMDASISLQAHTISHHGNTVLPDLVSVKLQPNAQSDRPVHAVFVFDQRVSHPVPGRFRLDDVAKGTSAVVLPAHPRRVRVTFAALAAKTSTFATVRAGAVRSSQADQVGVSNVLWSFRISRETTALPDAGYSVPFLYEHRTGTPILTATFDFDTTLNESTDAGGFHLYDAAGLRYDADQCTVTNYRTDLPEPMSVATCTFPTAPVWGHGAHTATVDANAVHDEVGLGNPAAAREGYLKY